jgi:hypothetical protein
MTTQQPCEHLLEVAELAAKHRFSISEDYYPDRWDCNKCGASVMLKDIIFDIEMKKYGGPLYKKR